MFPSKSPPSYQVMEAPASSSPLKTCSIFALAGSILLLSCALLYSTTGHLSFVQQPTEVERPLGSSLDYNTRRLVEKVQRIEDAACTICKTVVSTIDDFISDDATEKQIKDGLETVCSILPSSMEKMCDSMVDTYSDLAVQIVTKEYTPEQVCEEFLGICEEN